MKTQSTFAKLFFASSAALLVAALSSLPPGMPAVVPEAGVLLAADTTEGADGGDLVGALLARCPGRTQPVCAEAQSGGIKLFFYFP